MWLTSTWWGLPYVTDSDWWPWYYVCPSTRFMFSILPFLISSIATIKIHFLDSSFENEHYKMLEYKIDSFTNRHSEKKAQVKSQGKSCRCTKRVYQKSRCDEIKE